MPKTVALLGLDLSQIDFSNPDYAHFAHVGEEGIRALLEKDRAGLIALGFETELIFSPIDPSAARAAVRKGASHRTDTDIR